METNTAQDAALATLLAAKPMTWVRANGDTFAISTGDALVRRGLAEYRAMARTAKGSDSAYRLTGRGIIAARRATA